MPNIIYYNPSLKPCAQELRRNQTPEEKHLWYDFLSQYPCRFRRQRQFGRFIVDFYCGAAKLIVELDGSQHYESQGQAYDRERTAYLEGLGLKVIRFSNHEVNVAFRTVCETIDACVNERMNHE